MSRRALIAKVHVAKKQLGLDEETYRAILERVTGRRSAAQLDDRELMKVLADFRLHGWVPASSAPKRSDSPHVRKAWAIWGDMCRAGIPREPTRAALRAFVARMTGVTDPEWLSPEQANVVVEGLKAWQRRAVVAVATESEPAHDAGRGEVP